MEKVVGKLIASSLLLILVSNAGLPAFLADRESDLPACCRRDGKHHCAMLEALEKQERESGPSCKAAANKCPMYPKAAVTYSGGHWVAFAPAGAVTGPIATQPVSKAQTEVLYRISHSRARQKRGPPSSQ